MQARAWSEQKAGENFHYPWAKMRGHANPWNPHL
jgi:hypothetical protein